MTIRYCSDWIPVSLKRSLAIILMIHLGGGTTWATAGAIAADGAVRSDATEPAPRPAAEYEILPGPQGRWQAPNRIQGYRTHFDARGARIAPLAGSDDPAWELSLAVIGYGRGATVRPITPASATPVGKRIDYRRGAVTEWYVNDERGLKQGFVLARPPEETPAAEGASFLPGGRRGGEAGPQPAFLVVVLGGDLVPSLRPDGQSIDFSTRAGGISVLRYGELAVTDATGRVLRSWMEGFAEAGMRGIRLLFEDEGAVYPVTIDPLTTTAAWTGESNRSNAQYGASVASAGDVNGDGYDDVIVGAPAFPTGGRAFVYHGSPSGLSSTAAWTAAPAASAFGRSVASAGDVNGDGYDDVIVGAQDQAFLYLGSSTGLGTSPAWQVTRSGGEYGFAVSGAGDVNGDGKDDWIVSDYLTGGVGVVFAYHGSTLPLSTVAAWTHQGFYPGSGQFGYAVASAGNVNGDAYDDIIIADPSSLETYVFLGGSPTLQPGPAWVYFGYFPVVSAAGDVNGDGVSDWILGSPDDGAGSVFLFLGSRTFLPPSPRWAMSGEAIGDRFGSSLAVAGDVDGNGTDDVLIGASRVRDPQGGFEGRAYLYYGSGTSPCGGTRDCLGRVPAWTADGKQLSAQFGSAVAGAGDVNGDGYADVIVGAPYGWSGQFAEGRAFVYHGAASVTAAGIVANLGLAVSGAPTWGLISGSTPVDPWNAPDVVSFGSLPRSVLLTTGRVEDGGLGDTDWRSDGLSDLAFLGFNLSVPPGQKTLCFNSQFVTSETPAHTDSAHFCFRKNGICAGRDHVLSRPAFQPYNPVVGHCIDVSDIAGTGSLFLRFEVCDDNGTTAAACDGNGRGDSGLLLSRFQFSTLPMPPDALAESTADGYFFNPTPADASLTAGSFVKPETLFEVPGVSLALPFSLSITYNSASYETGSLGPKWSHSYEIFAQKLPRPGDPPEGQPGDSAAEILVRPGVGALYFREMAGRCVPGPLNSGPGCDTNADCPLGLTCNTSGYGAYTAKHGGTFGSIAVENLGQDENAQKGVVYTSKEGVVYELRYRRGTPGAPSRDDERLLPESITDENNLRMRFAYANLDGHVVNADSADCITDTRGTCFVFDKDLTGRLRGVKMGSGGCTTAAQGWCIVAANAPRVSFDYDPAGMLRSFTDLRGKTTTFTYANDGTLLTATDADGVLLVSNTYETFGGLALGQTGERLVSQRDGRDPDPSDPQAGAKFAYDDETMVITDRIGRQTTTDYDIKGRAAVTIDPFGVRQEVTYDRDNNPVERRRQVTPECPLQVTGRSTYDDRGNLLVDTAFPSQCVSDGSACATDADCGLLGDGRPAASCGVRTALTYDNRNNVISTTNHVGSRWSNRYDPRDNLILERDPLGNLVIHEYSERPGGVTDDYFPSPTRTTDARGHASTCSYDDNGYLLTATGPLPSGGTTRHTYNTLGQRTSTANPLGQRTCIDYDDSGLPLAHYHCTLDAGVLKPICVGGSSEGQICVTDSSCPSGVCGQRTTTSYDAQGRTLAVTEANGAVSRFAYTATGQIRERTDPLGNSVRFEYDAMDRPVASETANPAERPGISLPRIKVELEYGSAGDDPTRVRVTDVDGIRTLAQAHAEYDEQGRLSAVRDPNGGVSRFEYDLLGRPVLHGEDVDDSGVIDYGTRSSYDGRDLLVARRNAREQEIAYLYDAAGRLIQTAFPGAVIDHVLDPNGNRTSSVRGGGTITRVFDELDRLVTRTDPFGNRVDYQYDAAGNLIRLTYPSDLDGDLQRDSVSYAYDALSRLIRVTDWEGRVTSYAYDAAGRLARATLPDGAVVTYSYDAAGRLTALTDIGAAGAYFSASYGYNEAGVRTSAHVTQPPACQPGLNPGVETFGYAYQVDPTRPGNELLVRNGTDQFSYDADGNLASGTIGGLSRTLEHNALNELTRFGADTFRYDADGLRVEAVRGGVARRFVHDVTSASLLEEHDVSGNLVARYVYGLGLISRAVSPGNHRVYHYDDLGSTVALTNGTGTITDCYAYDPYGRPAAGIGATDNPFRYHGRHGIVDDGNGLYLMGSRYYSPELMRFIEKDRLDYGELINTQSLNRYAFAQGNPIQSVDPDGGVPLLIYGFALVGAVINIAFACAAGCTQPDGSLDWALIIGAGVEGAVSGGITGALRPLALKSGGLIDKAGLGAFSGMVGALAGSLARNFAAGLGLGSSEPDPFGRIAKGAISGAIGGVLGGAKTGGSTDLAHITYAEAAKKIGAQAGKKIAFGFLKHAASPKGAEQLSGAIASLLASLFYKPPTGIGGPKEPGIDTSGTRPETLNPLAAPTAAPPRATSCGCACEVWR